MEANAVDLTDFVKLNIKFLHVFGCFFPDFHGPSLKKCAYWVYSVVVVVSLFGLCFASQITFFVISYGDFGKMMEVSFLLFTNVAQAFKLYCFLNYGSRIWNLLHKMNENIFQPRNDVQCDIVESDMRVSKIITKSYLLACTLTCMSWSISPLTEERGGGKMRLPLNGWYPFRTDKSPVFELIYVYQCLSTWLNGVVDISMNTFISGTIMFISAQLSILNDELVILGEKVEEDSVRRHFCDHLLRCINHYKSIIK
ncbi:uncharacterized protein LOC135128848 [Zophobas morio]